MDGKLIVWMLCLNAAAALACFLYQCLWKKDARRGGLFAAFFVLVPVVGELFVLGANFINWLFFRKGYAELSEDELSFSKKRTRMIISDDIERDSNIVPIEEALRISDTVDKRQSFLEVLKRLDVEDYTGGIQDAMEHGDTEVVHYAASYITDTIAKYKDGERRLRELCNKDATAEVLLEYLHFCSDILNKKIFSEPEQQNYLQYYGSYMDQLYQLDPAKVDGSMIARLLALIRGEEASPVTEKWIQRAENMVTRDVDATKAVLEYYYAKKNSGKFRDTLEAVKASELAIDSELLEWIRFFS